MWVRAPVKDRDIPPSSGRVCFYFHFKCLSLNCTPKHWRSLLFFWYTQDHEKPRPPQKPLPADPPVRGYRLAQSTSAVGMHTSGTGAISIPIPTAPRPSPAIPQPARSVKSYLNFLKFFRISIQNFKITLGYTLGQHQSYHRLCMSADMNSW